MTECLRIDAHAPEPAILAHAAAILRSGGLVAFPTETVYGLGANALDAAAVARIFTAKGRPSNNPLIVHIAELAQVAALTTSCPDTFLPLANAFWPGPLTLVLPKSDKVPDIVTGGGPTVAVRMPAHPVALALLRAVQLPLAAPSANRSSALSPTCAAHVLQGLDGRIDLVLDAGPTQNGIESTVLDLTMQPPRLLRPGPLSPSRIEAIIGPIARILTLHTNNATPLASPGLLPRHYAPRTPLECAGVERARDLVQQGLRVAWVTFSGAEALNATVRAMPRESVAYAAQLYAVLHELDALGLDQIIVEPPPDGDDWLAIRDRLRRASFQEGD